MSVPSVFLKDDKMARAQYHCIELFFDVNGGAASLISAQQAPVIVVDANGDSSQALVNSLLEFDSNGDALSATSTSELAYATACGSTALGTDAVACVIKMAGQVKRSIFASCELFSESSSAWKAEGVKGVDGTVPPNTLTNYLYKTPAGNLFVRFIANGFDSVSSGYMIIRIWCELK